MQSNSRENESRYYYNPASPPGKNYRYDTTSRKARYAALALIATALTVAGFLVAMAHNA